MRTGKIFGGLPAMRMLRQPAREAAPPRARTALPMAEKKGTRAIALPSLLAAILSRSVRLYSFTRRRNTTSAGGHRASPASRPPMTTVSLNRVHGTTGSRCSEVKSGCRPGQ